MKEQAIAAEEPRPEPRGNSEETVTWQGGIFAISKPREKKEKREPSEERGAEMPRDLKERKGAPLERDTNIRGETAMAMAGMP